MLLFHEKGSRGDCNSYWGINLFSVMGKVNRRVLNERMKTMTEKSVGRGVFRKGGIV